MLDKIKQVNNRLKMVFLKKYLKWISTFLVLTGILLTNLNIYPVNITFHGVGVVVDHFLKCITVK